MISIVLQALLARERARAEFQDWEKKEEEVDIFIFYTLKYLEVAMEHVGNVS